MASITEYLYPDWPAPSSVKALCTLRTGGCSEEAYSRLNLAAHVGDNPELVALNRQRLMETASLPSAPCWLRQVHGTEVVEASEITQECEADASYTSSSEVLCVVLTADCLPVLIYDRRQKMVAAVHAGWRGLAAGIIEATLKMMGAAGEDVIAWLGPAIGPKAFEVDTEVYRTFTEACRDAQQAFTVSRPDHWYADINQLARQRFKACQVNEIYGGKWCTVSDPERFYSYRRDGETGRMATLIWLQD